MPAFEAMSDQLDFEEHIRSWSEPEKFIAREVRQINMRCEPCLAQITDHEQRIASEEKKTKALFAKVDKITNPRPSRKNTLATGGIAGAIALGLLTFGEWLIKNFPSWLK